MDGQFSEAELIGFLEYLAKKNMLSSSTVSSRKVAVTKVLSAVDKDEKEDLRTLDKELLFHRFTNKLGKDFTPESLATYKSRFNVAYADFISYKENPSGFRIGKSKKSPKENGNERKADRKKETDNVVDSNPPNKFHFETKAYVLQIPISNGSIIEVKNLPMELSVEDANKIAAIIKAHVIKE